MRNYNTMKNMSFTHSTSAHALRRVAIFAAVLVMSMVNVGTMWGATSSTFYFAIDAATVAGNYDNVQFCIKYSSSDWSEQTKMTRQDATYGGKLLYKATYSFEYGGYHNWQFMCNTSQYVEWYAGDWNTNLHSGDV